MAGHSNPMTKQVIDITVSGTAAKPRTTSKKYGHPLGASSCRTECQKGSSLIIFCEECGTQHEVSDGCLAGKNALLTCEGCHETLTVPGAASSIAGPSQKPIRLLIVDDSRLIRAAVRRLFEADGQVQVVGEAANGREALDLLPPLKPDVITLDINMPEMDGLSTLKHIMIKHPTPTVMFSALTREGATETFDALRFGAIDFMPKPSQSKGDDIAEQERLILQKVKIAAGVEIGAVRMLRTVAPENTGRPLPTRSTPRALSFSAHRKAAMAPFLKLFHSCHPICRLAYMVILYATPAHVDAFADYLNANSAIAVQRLDRRPPDPGRHLLSGRRQRICQPDVHGRPDDDAGQPLPFSRTARRHQHAHAVRLRNHAKSNHRRRSFRQRQRRCRRFGRNPSCGGHGDHAGPADMPFSGNGSGGAAGRECRPYLFRSGNRFSDQNRFWIPNQLGRISHV